MFGFPVTVIRLLLSSFVFVMGRAVALPFMALYLTEHLGMNQQAIGWVLGGSIFFSTLFGLYAGYLADRMNKSLLMMLACLIVAVCTALLTVAAHALAALLALICIESALTMRGISLKAMLADLLPPEQRPRAFSLNYMLINMAFSIGPLFGAWLFAIKISAPLWLAAAFSLMASQVLGFQRSVPTAHGNEVKAKPTSFKETLRVLRSDRRLILFTTGSILTSFVFGRFVSGYLSQYLILSKGTQAAAQLLPYVLMTNAVTVVLLQYPVGKLMQAKYLFRWVTLGAMLYVLGLLGFMHAAHPLSWVLATLAFTIGEVIVIPCEYMFIDMIAPADKRGSYYGAQSLATFGAAFNPLVCGYLLAHFPTDVMFWVLIAAACLGIVMYYAGTRSKAVTDDTVALTSELLPETRSPAVLPIPPISSRAQGLRSASKKLAGNRIKSLFPLS